MKPLFAAIPVKPFGVAKARLHPVLDAARRSRLGKAMAERTAQITTAAGARSVIVAAEAEVLDWASGLGLEVLVEPGDMGLDGAAEAGVQAARASGTGWAIVHADLPLVAVADLEALFAAVPEHGIALAPATDGGSNVIAGRVDAFPFAYGPASFHRHLRAAHRLPHRIVTRPGLALDLDGPADLRAALAHPAGDWLSSYV